MMDQRIVLNVRSKDLIDLYTRRGTLDPFRSPRTRLQRKLFLRVMLAVVVLVICSLVWMAAAWLIVLAAILVLIAVVMIVHAFIPTMKARYAVYDWARKVEMSGEFVLHLQDQGFTVHNAGSEYITKWGAVERVEIHDDYVVIVTNDERICPRASMRPEDFDSLRDVLNKKVLSLSDTTPLVQGDPAAID